MIVGSFSNQIPLSSLTTLDSPMEDDEQTPSPNPNSNLRIHHQFYQLQRRWDHYKTSSNHRSPPPTMLPLPQPEDDLIHPTPSSTWKIRTNQLAQDDIRRERRATIASGNFKARRLSYDDVVALPPVLNPDFLHGDYFNGFLQDQIVAPSVQSFDSGEDYCNPELGRVKEGQLPVCLNALSYSSAPSSSSSSRLVVPPQMKEQTAAKVEENVTPTVGEKREIGNRCKIGKWGVGLASLAIALVATLIISLRCSGFGAYEEEQFPFLLVPT